MSTKYTTSDLNTDQGTILITLANGKQTTVQLQKDWTAEDLDDAVWRFQGGAGVPSFLQNGLERDFTQKASDNPSDSSAETARAMREEKLEQSDILMLPDFQALMTDSEKTSVIAYRKELRGLPAAGTSKWNPSYSGETFTGVTWPTNVAETILTKYKDQ
tara:strand:- start:5369 stop:5848 length:480 start_codon:yes stop_codon:yes gene_type:complete